KSKQEVPGMGWFTIFADPDGTVGGLWQAMNPPKAAPAKKARPAAAKKAAKKASKKAAKKAVRKPAKKAPAKKAAKRRGRPRKNGRARRSHRFRSMPLLLPTGAIYRARVALRLVDSLIDPRLAASTHSPPAAATASTSSPLRAAAQ